MRMLDLFSGIGGFSLAAQWVWGDDLEIVSFCEIDLFCQQVLKKNWPMVRCHDNIKNFDGSRYEEIDIITGGFPCQDISTAGSCNGIDGERSGLWSEMFRVVGEVRPRYALIENSPNLVNLGLERILSDLASIGYDAEWGCISACSVGAYHRRKRIWIVAYPECKRLQEQGKFTPQVYPKEGAFRQADRLIDAFLEGSLPYVCGGHDGIPSYVDRPMVKALGNAIVPQVAEVIFRAIKEIDQ